MSFSLKKKKKEGEEGKWVSHRVIPYDVQDWKPCVRLSDLNFHQKSDPYTSSRKLRTLALCIIIGCESSPGIIISQCAILIKMPFIKKINKLELVKT